MITARSRVPAHRWPDQNYFARRFRARFGLNATTYRKQFTHTTARLCTWLADGTSTPI